MDPAMIFQHGQVWRLVTWILIPPESLDFFTIIMLFFYYSIAKVLERTWGDFLFNVYIFGGLILTVAGACVMYGVLMAVGSPSALLNIQAIPYYCSTYYVNMSIFLAFALTYPDMEVLLYFFIWSFPDLPVLQDAALVGENPDDHIPAEFPDLFLCNKKYEVAFPAGVSKKGGVPEKQRGKITKTAGCFEHISRGPLEQEHGRRAEDRYG